MSVIISVRCPLDSMHYSVILIGFLLHIIIPYHTKKTQWAVSSWSIIITHMKIRGSVKMKCSFISHWKFNRVKLLVFNVFVHNRACTHFVFVDVIHYVFSLLDASCVVCFISQRFVFHNCSSLIEYFAIFTSILLPIS